MGKDTISSDDESIVTINNSNRNESNRSSSSSFTSSYKSLFGAGGEIAKNPSLARPRKKSVTFTDKSMVHTISLNSESAESTLDPNDDQNEEEKQYERLNQFITQIGMGSYQWKMFFVCGLGWIADNLWYQINAQVIPKVQLEFNIPEQGPAAGFSNSATYLGMMIGSVFWGIMSDVIGRRPAFLITLVIGTVFGGKAKVEVINLLFK